MLNVSPMCLHVCVLAEMFSVEAEARKEKREAERREREELALKKDDVRRKVKKYDRLHGQTKPKVGHFVRCACCFNNALESLISDAPCRSETELKL